MSPPARWGDMESPVKPANDAEGRGARRGDCPYPLVTPAKAGVQDRPLTGFQRSLE